MTYEEAIRYLYGLINYEKINFSYSDLKLERMRELVNRLGNPQNDFPIILVAGTKGKGSTSYFLERIFLAWGRRCGFYTKPHLLTFRERIRLGGSLIPPADLASLVEKVKPVVEEMKNSPWGKPTYFEVSVALAFLYFSLNKVEIAVVEVGLGGRLDATNVCEPQLTVITPVSFDHTDILGDTLSAIAREKAGILRRGTKLILSPQEKEAREAILEEAEEKGSPVVEMTKECQWQILSREKNGSLFSFSVKNWGEGLSHLSFLGDHQVINLLTALLAVREWGLSFNRQKLEKALENLCWPGRIQVLSAEPLVIFDVAHNQASFSQLLDTLTNFLGVEKAVFLLGFLEGKDYEGIAKQLKGFAYQAFLTSPLNPKAVLPQVVSPYLEKEDVNWEIVKDPFQAKKLAAQFARDKGLPLVVAGSFYLAKIFAEQLLLPMEEVKLC
ncbi:MAG: dihydrofolate synthase / folylpolyglutamate synthase [Candidatus Atribacteria bacterium]|nr:dihydrofolate synthase / folylpolyglutamate synthase [Candidatus Atribacteria bacterium]